MVYLHGLQTNQRQQQDRHRWRAEVSGSRGKHCEKLQGQEGSTIVCAAQAKKDASGERDDRFRRGKPIQRRVFLHDPDNARQR